MPSGTAERLPARPSYMRERTVRLGRAGESERVVYVGMDRPTSTADGWWTAVAWARDEAGIVSCLDVAPLAGPPPDPPLARMGPAFAGSLSGLVAEIAGRQAVRLRLPEAADPARPWDRPLILQIALQWDPVRAATTTPNALAAEALGAVAHAIDAASRPA
jgi:hypothetical protein